MSRSHHALCGQTCLKKCTFDGCVFFTEASSCSRVASSGSVSSVAAAAGSDIAAAFTSTPTCNVQHNLMRIQIVALLQTCWVDSQLSSERCAGVNKFASDGFSNKQHRHKVCFRMIPILAHSRRQKAGCCT